MLYDNLPVSLPWYPRIELQDRLRQNVAVDPKICQLAPYDGVLPFQFRKPARSELPVNWVIKCVGAARAEDYMAGHVDAVVVDMSSFIMSALQWTTLDDTDIFTFIWDNNSFDLITTTVIDGLPPGIYYMEMEFTQYNPEDGYGGNWVSETFRVPEDRFSWIDELTCNYPRIMWYHETDLKPIHYLGDGSFYNLLFLDTFITASEPVFEIKGEEDGLGELIPTFQKAIIKYRISAIVPDFIKVALYIMQMHDYKEVMTERGFRHGEIKNPEVSHSLLSDGAYSVVELLFEQMQLITNTACSDQMEPPLGYEIGYTPTLVTTFCNGSGGIFAHVTTLGVPFGTYGVLQGRIGLGAFTNCYPYISRTQLLSGWSGNIGGGTGFTSFRVVFWTFSFSVGNTATSFPVPSC